MNKPRWRPNPEKRCAKLCQIPGLTFVLSAMWKTADWAWPSLEAGRRVVAAAVPETTPERCDEWPAVHLTPAERLAALRAISRFLRASWCRFGFPFALAWFVEGEATAHLDHSRIFCRERAEIEVRRTLEIVLSRG